MDPNMPMPMPNNSSMDSMMMHMSFYWGKDAIIFFSGWPKYSLVMYLLSLLVVLLLAVAIEVLSVSPPSSMGGIFVQTIVYGLRMGFAYLVMLAVMSYNIGIFIAAVLGHALGFAIVKARARAFASRSPNETIPK